MCDLITRLARQCRGTCWRCAACKCEVRWRDGEALWRRCLVLEKDRTETVGLDVRTNADPQLPRLRRWSPPAEVPPINCVLFHSMLRLTNNFLHVPAASIKHEMIREYDIRTLAPGTHVPKVNAEPAGPIRVTVAPVAFKTIEHWCDRDTKVWAVRGPEKRSSSSHPRRTTAMMWHSIMRSQSMERRDGQTSLTRVLWVGKRTHVLTEMHQRGLVLVRPHDSNGDQVVRMPLFGGHAVTMR